MTDLDEPNPYDRNTAERETNKTIAKMKLKELRRELALAGTKTEAS